MRKLAKIFTALAGVVAALPIIGLLSNHLIYHDPSEKVIWCIFLEAEVIFFLVFTWVNRIRIQSYSITKINRLIVSLFFVFFASVLCYIILDDLYILMHPTTGEHVLIPFWMTDELKKTLNTSTYYEYLIANNVEGLRETIRRDANTQLFLSKCLYFTLLSVTISSFAVILFVFGISSQKEGTTLSTEE